MGAVLYHRKEIRSLYLHLRLLDIFLYLFFFSHLDIHFAENCLSVNFDCNSWNILQNRKQSFSMVSFL